MGIVAGLSGEDFVQQQVSGSYTRGKYTQAELTPPWDAWKLNWEIPRLQHAKRPDADTFFIR